MTEIPIWFCEHSRAFISRSVSSVELGWVAPCWGFCGAPDKDVRDQCWVQGCVQPVCLMALPMPIDTSGQKAKHSLFLTVGQFWRKGTGLMTHTDEERTCSGPLRMPAAEHRVEARLLPPRINTPGKGSVHLTDLPHEGRNIS